MENVWEIRGTEIEVLDKLLGFKGEKSNIKPKPGSIILIRGEPGSGKTTLGLQILSQNLNRMSQEENDLRQKLQKKTEEQKETNSVKKDTIKEEIKEFEEKLKQLKKTKVAFFSLEGNPADVLCYAKEKYVFFASENLDEELKRFGRIEFFNAHYMDVAIYNEVKGGKTTERIDDFLKGTPGGDWMGPGILLARTLNSCVMTTLAKVEASREKIRQKRDYRIVFVDSLTVLLHLLQKHNKYKNIPERLLLNAICISFRQLFADSIIIFTGEYHYKDVTKRSAVEESFFCDVEIALFSEPIIVPANYESQFESPLGSNTLSLLDKEVKSIQTQSFCRVLKSRQAPNQTRRCAYDIVSKKGIEFYETYPGDGHLVTFAQNDPQTKMWEELFKQDLPLSYPAIRCNIFDRGSFERISAAQRRFRYVPQRTDMYLASFDNHWLNWYSEMCLKDNIADVLQQELGFDDFYLHKAGKFHELLNGIHAELTKTEKQIKFSRNIRNAVGNVLEIVYKFAAEELNKDANLVEKLPVDPKAMQGEEVFDDFMSELLDRLTRMDTEPANDDKTQTSLTGVDAKPPNDNKTQTPRDINRPCLQCLWNRSLLGWLYPYLTEGSRLLFLSLFNSKLNPKQPHKKNDKISKLENKLGKLIECVMTNCPRSHKDGCQIDKKLEGINEKSTEEEILRTFLFAEEKDCKWKQSIRNCISNKVKEKITQQLKNILPEDEREERIEKFIKKLDDSILKNIFSDNGHEEYKGLVGAIIKEVNETILFSKEIVERYNSGNKSPKPEPKSPPQPSPQPLLPDKLDIWKVIGDLEPFLTQQGVQKDEVQDMWAMILAQLFFDVMEGSVRYQLVAPIPGNKLRLYGERQSEIISELESHHPDARRPIHRPWHLFSMRDQNNYCSIPYDANISFIVFKKESLDDFYKNLKIDDYVAKIAELVKNEEAALEKIFQKKLQKSNYTINDVTTLVKESKEQGYPQTWEEIIAYFILTNENKPKENKYHFLIETRSWDSFLCTILEFIWSCGADLRIFPDYSIDNRDKTLQGLTRAFYLVGLMFQNGIIPLNSTLEVNEFSKIYGKQPDEKEPPEWVFARHWYSTFVDVLSAPNNVSKDKDKGKDWPATPVTEEKDFLWQEKDKTELGIMPIPVSFSNYKENKDKGEEARHISCWGDWHMAIFSGSENMELSIDLMNEIMASDRICERAYANASIPTVEEFYNQYGDNLCFNQPVRKNIIPPKLKYEELREKLFKNAISRSQIFDYHHCIREFHSVMEYIHFSALRINPNDKDANDKFFDTIYEKLEGALKNIESFKERPFLVS